MPTLHLPGLAANIIPSATVPTLIASDVFLVVHPATSGERCVDLDGSEDDLVISQEKFDPSKLTLDTVKKLLLGRYMQTCAAPPAKLDREQPNEGEPDEDEERPAKRARTEPENYRAGIAWGYEPTTRWLYCVTPSDTEFILDLSTEASGASAPRLAGPLVPEVVRCARLGPVSLTVAAAPGDAPRRDQFAQYSEWFNGYEGRVKELNAAEGVFAFEVGEDGALLTGDVNLSKGPEDEFECVIKDVRPGKWLVSHLDTPGEGEDDVGSEEESEDEETGEKRIVRVQMQHDEVEHALFADVPWTEIGTFSVDSGVWCIICEDALENAAEASGDREATLEALADWAADIGPRTPAGVVVSGNDGGYVIQGKQEDGCWALLRVLEY